MAGVSNGGWRLAGHVNSRADRDSAFPARSEGIRPRTAISKCLTRTYHTRNFMIVEFNNANNSHETSPEEKESPS